MQSTNLFPAAQTRQGQQTQQPNPKSVVVYPPYVEQAHSVGQQVFSAPPQSTPSYQSFPHVVKVTPQQPVFTSVQPSFPVVQQWPPQPTNHNIQAVKPQVLYQDLNQKPLFSASKDRQY